jgi:LuxR family quorum sensing-dependent transcriptional regulator
MSRTQSNSPLRMGAEHAREIAGLKTQFDIFRFLKRLTESWGMRAFMVINIPVQTSYELSEHTVITNWPAELLNQYDQESLLIGSTVVRELRNSVIPFKVDAEFLKQGREPAKVQVTMSLFERFDMVNSVWFPVHDVSGNRGAVSFSGIHTELSAADLAELFLIAAHVFDQLADIKSLDNRVIDTLNDREIDCLNWTAAGKTSAEIAEILLLSEHTVNHYLNRATKKLDTVNRTQAVAKALRVGLIK